MKLLLGLEFIQARTSPLLVMKQQLRETITSLKVLLRLEKADTSEERV